MAARFGCLVSLVLLGSGSTVNGFHFHRLRSKTLTQSEENLVIEHNFTQKLDHSDPTDDRMWQQRVWERRDFHKPGGPVFLFIGGEAHASPSYLVHNWTWETYAKKHNALMFVVEHRYYAPDSTPYSLARTMKYLSSEQALADLAFFISESNKGLPKATKWIVFGGSYSGSLAAWMRYKYPHLVHGAVASSAPVQAKLDFPGYMEVTKNVIQKYSKDCYKEVHAAIQEIDQLMDTPKGRRYLSHLFNREVPVKEDRKGVSKLFRSIAYNMWGCAQYYPRCNFTQFCAVMLNSQITSLSLRFQKAQLFFEASDDDAPEEKNWDYQKCTEFGFFKTSEKNQSLLGDHVFLEYRVEDVCAKYGSVFTEDFVRDAVTWTNTKYGGVDIDVSRVVFVYGSFDPWHVQGVFSPKNTESSSILIKGVSHCADMNSPAPTDPPALVEARRTILKILNGWLAMKQ